MSFEGVYSQVADDQLDALAAGEDAALYNAVLDACELVLAYPERARSRSGTVRTAEGLCFVLPVAGYPPLKVFWSADAPRVEAVFPYP